MNTENKDIVITRIFDAPIEQVWKMWTEPEHIMKWWGPDRFSCPSAKMDVREGGVSIVAMQAPQDFGGQVTYNTWKHTRIIPLQSLEFIQNLCDKGGNNVDPVSIGMPPDFPMDMRTVVTFKKLGENKTEITVTEYGWRLGNMRDMSIMGMEQCLDKMAATFTTAKPAGKNILKSIGAIIAGFITVIVLSIVTDIVMESLKFFPPQDKPELYTGGLLLIAFIYRSIYTIAGGYVVAMLAPNKPMRHAIILGALGMVMGTLGAVANWDKTGASGVWYPIALIVAAIPCTWLGGRLFEMARNKKNKEENRK